MLSLCLPLRVSTGVSVHLSALVSVSTLVSVSSPSHSSGGPGLLSVAPRSSCSYQVKTPFRPRKEEKVANAKRTGHIDKVFERVVAAHTQTLCCVRLHDSAHVQHKLHCWALELAAIDDERARHL